APGSVTIETMLTATGDIDVPVSFGFHPYLGIDGPREDWLIELPKMRHLALDQRQIPTGEAEPFPGLNGPLGTRSFDDGFALIEPTASLSVAHGEHKVSVDLLDGYTHTQIYAPPDKNFIAFEPMTAPANALISKDGLRLVPQGGSFSATFRIRVA
ncbi:MAG: aldose 1-epimerase, partial [Pseudomonadota bacterium]